jgi:hypothetical protein
MKDQREADILRDCRTQLRPDDTLEVDWLTRLHFSYWLNRAIRFSQSGTARVLGDLSAPLTIQTRQFLLPFDWLHLPQAGTRFPISEMYPVGRWSLTSGRKWSHSVYGSPQ